MHKTLVIFSIVSFFLAQAPFVHAATIHFGTAEILFDANTGYFAVDALDSGHVIFAYSDNDNAGYVGVATVDGTVIQVPKPASFFGADIDRMSVARLNSTHALLLYKVGSEIQAVVATIHDNTVSFGTPEIVTTDDPLSSNPQIAVLDESHFIISYSTRIEVDEETEDAQHIVAGTISDTNITLGSSTTLVNVHSPYNDIVAMDSTHFVVIYSTSMGEGYAVAGTVSGTVITTGSPIQYVVENNSVAATRLDSTRFLIGYRALNPFPVETIIGTVAGTSISFGSPTEVADDTNNLDLAQLGSTHTMLVRSVLGNFGRATQLTISGDTVSTDAEIEFGNNIADEVVAVALDDSSFFVAYLDSGGIYKLYGIVSAPPRTSTGSSESTSSAASVQSSGGGRRGSPGRGGVATALTVNRMVAAPSHPAAPAVSTPKASVDREMEKRTCERVMKWFKNDAKMLGRVNERLGKRFGFTCN